MEKGRVMKSKADFRPIQSINRPPMRVPMMAPTGYKDANQEPADGMKSVEGNEVLIVLRIYLESNKSKHCSIDVRKLL